MSKNKVELDKEQMEGWNRLVNKTHTQQAIWWLNGFWGSLENEADTIWDLVHIMIEIECGKPKKYGKLKWEEKEGNDLDQFQAHRFLEQIGESMTVKELRSKIGFLDIDKNKRLSLTEYLVDKYKKKIVSVIEAPQGGQAAQEALDRATKKVEDAVVKMNEASAAAEQAAESLAEAKVAEEESALAKQSVQEAVDEVEAQEKEYNSKIEKLKTKIENKDGRLSTMKINTAKAELAQAEAEDPLPLRKAKLTQKAALKKQKKANKACQKAEKKAAAASEAAEVRKTEAETSLAEAREALRELKEEGDGIAHGNIWWMEKELAERQKNMPKKKKK